MNNSQTYTSESMTYLRALRTTTEYIMQINSRSEVRFRCRLREPSGSRPLKLTPSSRPWLTALTGSWITLEIGWTGWIRLSALPVCLISRMKLIGIRLVWLGSSKGPKVRLLVQLKTTVRCRGWRHRRDRGRWAIWSKKGLIIKKNNSSLRLYWIQSVWTVRKPEMMKRNWYLRNSKWRAFNIGLLLSK